MYNRHYCKSIFGPIDPQQGYDPSEVSIGECESCGIAMSMADDGYTDNEGHEFCSARCGMDYYGIRKMEEKDKDKFYQRSEESE